MIRRKEGKCGTIGWITYRKKHDDYKFEVRKDLAAKASVDDMFDYEVKNLVYDNPGLVMIVRSESDNEVNKVVTAIKRLLPLV